MRIIRNAAIGLLLAVVVAPAAGQAFKPSKPVEFVLHGGPGSGGDVSARFIIAIMEQENLVPQRVQVSNKTGGGGAVAMSYMAQKKGDGHVIALFSPLWMTGSIINAEWQVDFTELAPIARLVLDPALIVVKADAPYKTLADFVEASKKAPGQLKQAGGSLFARDNIVRMLIQRASGANWVYVPYPSGSQRVVALLGGHVQLFVSDAQEVKEHIRNKSVRVLAVVGDKRLPHYPDAPTVQEAGVGNVPNVRSMRGVVGTAAMPRDAVEYWENVFQRVTQTDAWRKYLDENSVEDGFQKGADLAKSAAEYRAQQREIFKQAGIKMYR